MIFFSDDGQNVPDLVPHDLPENRRPGTGFPFPVNAFCRFFKCSVGIIHRDNQAKKTGSLHEPV